MIPNMPGTLRPAPGLSLLLRVVLLAGLLCLAASCSEKIRLSESEIHSIGQRVFENECGAKVACLTSWNKGEEFASLGIGHFIWYPAGAKGPFEESFPDLIAFMQRRGLDSPDWLIDKACPWLNRNKFLEDIDNPKMQELRAFLADTMDIQAEFIAGRLQNALPKILDAAQPNKRRQVRKQFYRMARSPGGMYALVDYVNFKGEGISPAERYKGQGWGLLQVLERMQGQEKGVVAVKEFSRAAKEVLQQRVRNSPPERNEKRWLEGWEKRVDSYMEAGTVKRESINN